jgi:hypothetical protein
MTERRKVTTQPEESSADACRRLGWKPGDRLVGDEGYGPTVIEITAIGKKLILAAKISPNGNVDDCDSEAMWTLSCRDWKKVKRKEGAVR